MKRTIAAIPLFILLVMLLGACSLPMFSPRPTADIGAIHTAAAQTMAVQLTQAAQGGNIFPTSTPLVILPSSTPLVLEPVSTQVSLPTSAPTATQAPANTAIPAATATLVPTLVPTQVPTQVILPSATPTRVPPTAAPTATPVPCLVATYIKDVTIPDWSKMQPGWDISKTWRVRNDGSCTWTRDFSLVFSKGDVMSGVSTSFPQDVKPGQSVDISVDLVVPSGAGDYRGYWLLQSANGKRFGVGRTGDVPLSVAIEVIVPIDGSALNFATMYCTAKWESSVKKELSCPGVVNDKNGFAYRLESPRLETKQEDKAALWMQPDAGFNGWITGTYPKYKIVSGDNFKASVGCLENSPRCDVTFQLHYRTATGPALIELGTWQEISDARITEIDIDLSYLAGQEIEFVLTVMSNGDSTEDAAFWLFPRIER